MGVLVGDKADERIQKGNKVCLSLESLPQRAKGICQQRGQNIVWRGDGNVFTFQRKEIRTTPTESKEVMEWLQDAALAAAAMSEIPQDTLEKRDVNRLKAKARFLEQERLRSGSEQPNTYNKRRASLEVTPYDSTSPTAPDRRHVPSIPSSSSLQNASAALQSSLQSGPSRVSSGVAGRSAQAQAGIAPPAKDTQGRLIRTSEFVEYDLSTLKNSKGGFLLIDEEDDPRIARQRRLEEERKAQRQKEAAKVNAHAEDPALWNPSEAPKCQQCGTIELDFQIWRIFRVPVCPKCKVEHPEKYSLLTKTECKEDYLLTDPELKDEDLLPHLLKPNPHRATYNNMMLYLRCQVEDFAFGPDKWGSPEALDAEFEKRQADKKARKDKKFEAKLKELRRKTKSNLHVQRREAAHVHSFVLRQDEETGQEQEVCDGCGMAVEVETL